MVDVISWQALEQCWVVGLPHGSYGAAKERFGQLTLQFAATARIAANPISADERRRGRAGLRAMIRPARF